MVLVVVETVCSGEKRRGERHCVCAVSPLCGRRGREEDRTETGEMTMTPYSQTLPMPVPHPHLGRQSHPHPHPRRRLERRQRRRDPLPTVVVTGVPIHSLFPTHVSVGGALCQTHPTHRQITMYLADQLTFVKT